MPWYFTSMKLILIIVLVLAAAVIFTISRNLTVPKLGVIEGRLTPCPKAPHCVHSQSDEPNHKITPFPHHPQGIEFLKTIIETKAYAKILEVKKNYIHAEFASPTLGFRDDVEFYKNDESSVIDVRSASRVGYYDFDMNRQRIENLRSDYLKKRGQA